MSELWITDIERGLGDTPRGVASNSGFEAEDAARALQLAQNALNSQYWRCIDHFEKLASMLWWQNKHRVNCTETEFIRRFLDDIDMVSKEHAKDGVLRRCGEPE